MAKQSNYDKIRGQTPEETSQFRDVHGEQQLERGKIGNKQTMTSRTILTVIVAILVFSVMYVMVSGVQYGFYAGSNFMSSITSNQMDSLGVPTGSQFMQDENGTFRYKWDADGEFHDAQPDYDSLYAIAVEQGVIDPNAPVEEPELKTFKDFLKPNLWNAGISVFVTLLVTSILYTFLRKNLAAQNAMETTEDVNQYPNDARIQESQEVMERYDIFPDTFAHSSVQPSSMLSHAALLNKGIKTVRVAKRLKADVLDEDGDVVQFKGDYELDENGERIFETKPMFDSKYMEELFDASGLPKSKALRKYWDATQISYNADGRNRDKLGKFKTVADLINEDWEIPYYEPGRPGGVYIVDTAPVNTMVLAITRAGKGQTVIEPTIDMWLREKRPNNMVINDPKGELLVKFYVPATVRGFQPVQFNLINAMKTDIFNPLHLAYEAAREGDFTKTSTYIENIADVFFPLDGGDDPVWPNAANNAFKRAAYGLIDYYLEEEAELRLRAAETGMNQKTLSTELDHLWGHVTLYNTYQLFVQLTSKKLKNPGVVFNQKMKAGEFDSISDEEFAEKKDLAERQSELWEDKPELDLLSLYFNCTAKLPRNSMRQLVDNTNSSLRAMAGAEKMMASVYGIAITAMSFFTDPTISTLTSGTPSQNADLSGISFPRCFGVRFHSDFLEQYHLIGQQVKWMSYSDPDFKNELGKDFYHEDTVTREGWAKYYFKGMYPSNEAYVHLRIVNPRTGQLIRQCYFKFVKSYQTSLDGRTFVKDPVLGEKIVNGGILTELIRYEKKDGSIVIRPGHITFVQEKIIHPDESTRKTKVKTSGIVSTTVRYSEKPKVIFLVTPPHLMKYAKLILILVKQLVDLNFDRSYMTKSNQKPLYKTRFMLDELGNLQSEGHGISGFSTMLSIGLGQEQQFTLILQTLQQLRDVYGDSVDKIVQGNTSNIVFLKSTDDSMLDTLQKMSGTTHKSYINSKTVTRDLERIFLPNEGKLSYTMQTQEMPVISYNDMAFLPERNSIVFRAGDFPIWNRNETILPMSWRLMKNAIKDPGHEYSLQTIPTLSSALDFDVRKNQPDFQKMLEKRMDQALVADEAKECYQKAYGYSDYDVSQLDADNYSMTIMEIVNRYLKQRKSDYADDNTNVDENEMMCLWDNVEENTEQLEENAKQQKEYDKKFAGGYYAGGILTRADLIGNGVIAHARDPEIITAFTEVRGDMERDPSFTFKNGELWSADGTKPYITRNKDVSKNLDAINKAMKDGETLTYGDHEITEEELSEFNSWTVTDDFYRFLVSMDTWDFAKGRFEQAMSRLMHD